jgi:outer membrane protein TolC
VPPAYESASAAEEKPPELHTDWWRLFGDAELERLEEEAIAANQDLKAAMARVLEARAAARIVESSLYPLLTFDPSISRQRTAIPHLGQRHHLDDVQHAADPVRPLVRGGHLGPRAPLARGRGRSGAGLGR